jgi:hypothetical protein
LVTARTPAGSQRDVTREATYRSADPGMATAGDGVVRPAASGRTAVEVAFAGRRLTVPVTVEHGDRFLAVDFTRDVVPILTHAGCNGGGCHGKAGGRGGFALSLFGFDPKAAYDAILNCCEGAREETLP